LPRPPATDPGHASRKDQLRRAAWRLFRDHGYEATSVDAICHAAQASKGAFYWHYAAKSDVFIDILESWSREVMDQMYAQFQAAVGAPDYAEATAAALAREFARGRVIAPVWLDFAVHARSDPAVRTTLAEFYARAREATAAMLRPALEGHLGEAEQRGVAAAVFGGYFGLLVQELVDPEGADAERAARGFMALLARVGIVGG